MQNKSNGKRLVPGGIVRDYAAGNMSLIRSRYQSFNGGSDWYDTQLTPGEPDFQTIFHDVWRLFFTPNPNIAQRIDSELRRLHLVPGQYVAAHLRALYAIDQRPQEQIRSWTHNALNCASQLLRPGQSSHSIFFTSDSKDATVMAARYGQMKGAAVQTRVPQPNPPLHLDFERNWANRPVSDFYDTFIDLYLIALGGCVTYNKGGFGHWGLLIGGDVSCFINQETKSKVKLVKKCSWLEAPQQQDQQDQQEQQRQDEAPNTQYKSILERHPLFLPPVTEAR